MKLLKEIDVEINRLTISKTGLEDVGYIPAGLVASYQGKIDALNWVKEKIERR